MQDKWMDSLSPEDEAELERLCFRTLLERARLASMMAPLGTLYIVWLVWETTPWFWIIGWMLLNSLSDGITYVLSGRWLKQPLPHARIPAALNWQIVLRVLQGLSWGAAIVFFHGEGETAAIGDMIILLLLISISAVSVTNMAPSFITMLTFCASILIVPFLFFLSLGESLYINLAIGLGVLFLVEMQIGWDAYRQFEEGMRQLVQNRSNRRQLELRNGQLDALNQTLQVMAVHDQLTGLYNRHFIVEQLERQYEMFGRYGSVCSIVLIDIDHFKNVNDSFGHGVGDNVLVSFARCVEPLLRQGDFFGRYGGEEFILVLPMTDSAAAAQLAERIRNKLKDSDLLAGQQDAWCLSASFGVAEIRSGESLDSWLVRVDQALYRAKDNGRDCVVEE
ncbi:MAG: GGDEF domain-containing protein [Sideroxydans sp.]|nr:GGDEF domain-containing protein [Sideroxydans sp.]